MSRLHALEVALAQAGADAARYPAPPTATERLAENRASVLAETCAPTPTRTARALRRLGLGDATVRLVTATPALRRSWYLAVAVAVLFAANAASSSTAEGADRIVVFLSIAPLVPLLGVALAFGRGVDPTHETIVAAPMDGFRVFLVRCLAVLAASVALLTLAALVVRDGGGMRIAWLLPALAVTSVGMAASSRSDPRRAAGAVAVAWIVVVVVTGQIADDQVVAFRAGGQLLALVVTALAAVVVTRNRRRYDELAAGSSS